MNQDRTEFSKAVRRAAWKRADGLCEMILEGGSRCGCALTTGKFAYDHIITDWMGGEATLENCQVICAPCHTGKTKRDAADRAKVKRQQDRHHGIRNPRQLQGRAFQKFEPAHRATKTVDKLRLGYVRPPA